MLEVRPARATACLPLYEALVFGKRAVRALVQIRGGDDPDATGAPFTIYVHSLGTFNKDNGHEVVGGPGSQSADHACDGKGIDYIDACFGP